MSLSFSIVGSHSLQFSLLLFDRTCTSLDDDSEKIYISLLGKLKGHCTVIVVSNKSTVMKYADKVFDFLDADGLHAEASADLDYRLL